MGVWERVGKRSVTLTPNAVRGKGTISGMTPLATLTVTVTLALALLAPGALLAQVGHAPGKSPYRDIRKGHTFTPFAAFFAGDGGRFGVAPHDGWVYGFRYDIRTGSTIQMGLLLGHGQMERRILDSLVAGGQVTGTKTPPPTGASSSWAPSSTLLRTPVSASSSPTAFTCAATPASFSGS